MITLVQPKTCLGVGDDSLLHVFDTLSLVRGLDSNPSFLGRASAMPKALNIACMRLALYSRAM